MQSTEVRVKKLVILFIRLDLCLGRRKRIMCSDWPPGLARGFILLARDFSLSFRSFLFCFNLNFFLLHTNAKKKTWPHAWSIAHLNSPWKHSVLHVHFDTVSLALKFFVSKLHCQGWLNTILLPGCLVRGPSRPKRFGSRGPSLGYVNEVNWPRGTRKTPYRD